MNFYYAAIIIFLVYFICTFIFSRFRKLLIVAGAAVLCAVIIFYPVSVRWLFLTVVERGPAYFEPVEVSYKPWLKASLADKNSIPRYKIGKFEEVGQGLSVFDIKVVTQDDELLDEIHALKIDPKYYDFSVHVAPGEIRDVDEWVDSLNAVAVINGSYYAKGGYPSTPVKSNGKAFGPSNYKANHGAFLVSGGRPHIEDLANQDWTIDFDRSSEAMVSYPLLLDQNGDVRAEGHDDWLANRSFVAQDQSGSIFLATTTTGYFSLRRLGMFLQILPLDIRYALNLDGGPVASLAVRSQNYSRSYYGLYELISRDNNPQLLKPAIEGKKFTLPIVLAVKAKKEE